MTFNSFRDPSGMVFFDDECVFRAVYTAGIEDYRAFRSSRASARLVELGWIVAGRELDSQEWARFESVNFVESPRVILGHERIEFPSFPYEWSPQMLAQAGLLTLDIAEALLEEGLGLKDATPFNVLFRGTRPVFVDWLSVERRAPSDPLWLAKAQFERTFVLPLLAVSYFGLGLDQVFIPNRDGLTPEYISARCGFWQRLNPDFFLPATLPAWLGRNKVKHRVDSAEVGEFQQAGFSEKSRRFEPGEAKFVLTRTFSQLRRQITKFRQDTPLRHSNWTNYDQSIGYSLAQVEAKQNFVLRVMETLRPQRVLDIGANMGRYSEICARSGVKVLAIDSDVIVMDRLYRRAEEQALDILPLHIDFARSSPAIGWRNQESSSFLDRAHGNFEGVLMLAVLHHLVVTERIPLRQILELAGTLARDFVIVEFVGNKDPMFRALARHRETLYEQFTEDVFEAECRRTFEISQVEQIDETDRRLYLLKKRREVGVILPASDRIGQAARQIN